jgi:hypothetical protein
MRQALPEPPLPPNTYSCLHCVKDKKVKLSLCLINEALCHEGVRGSGRMARPFLTSALDGGEWSASRPGRFAPGSH